MTIVDIKKPKICKWISDESWEKLGMKEKDFVIFVHCRKYTKEKIMRKLYLKDRTSYWRIQNNVRYKLKIDVEKYNKENNKTFKTAKDK